MHLIAYGYEVTAGQSEGLRRCSASPPWPRWPRRGRSRSWTCSGGRRRCRPSSTRRSRSARCAIWLQLGLRDDAAAARARAAGIPFIQDRCIKMEHCRWLGGLNWFGLATGVVSSRREEAVRAHAR